jgi:hypothetical protein
MGEGGWNGEIRWQEIRLMDVRMSGELGGTLLESWMEDSLLFNVGII